MVGSTERAIELGDRAWRELLRRHHRAVRAELRRYGGHEVDSAGDGFFATFPQPADAIRCAIAIRAAVRPLDLAVRSAVHTGEVERIGPKVGGIAVHLAARALSVADPGEILVTSTVRDLVSGSELTFVDAGIRTFKGFSEPWRVFRVTGPEPSVAAAPDESDGDRPRVAQRTAVVLAGLLGAALVVGVIVVLGLANQSPGVEPGPNTVHRIGLDDAVADVFAVARGPSALSVADGMLWVASEAGTVTRIDPSDGSTQVAGGVGIPTALAASDGSVWVAQGYDRRVARVDASGVEVREELPLHARRLAAAGEALWISDDLADRLVRVSTTTLAENGSVSLEAGSGPRGIVIADGVVWVANERAETLVQVDSASGVVVGHPIGIGSVPTDIAVGGGSVWVTSAGADLLYRIDPADGRVVATVDTCDGPDAVVASEDGVWVACRAGRVVRRFGTDGTPVGDIQLRGTPTALALASDGIWVALRTD
jgi:streptogramin lyase